MKMARYLVGPMIVALFVGAVYFLYLGQPMVCDLCGRPLHQETLYKVHLRDGEVTQACCPWNRLKPPKKSGERKAVSSILTIC